MNETPLCNFKMKHFLHAQTTVKLENGSLKFYCHACKQQHSEYQPSEYQWTQFLGQLEYLDCANWGTKMSKEDPFDDESLSLCWEFEILVNGKYLKVDHRNNSEALFGQDMSVSLFVAFSKLTNGMFVHHIR